MADLHAVGCDLLTITQYLRPTPRHHPVERWVKPEEFVELREEALQLGFAGVMSGPLVRSSYRAGRLYRQAAERKAATAVLARVAPPGSGARFPLRGAVSVVSRMRRRPTADGLPVYGVVAARIGVRCGPDRGSLAPGLDREPRLARAGSTVSLAVPAAGRRCLSGAFSADIH